MDFVVQLLYELDILKNVSSEIIRNDYDNFIKSENEIIEKDKIISDILKKYQGSIDHHDIDGACGVNCHTNEYTTYISRRYLYCLINERNIVKFIKSIPKQYEIISANRQKSNIIHKLSKFTRKNKSKKYTVKKRINKLNITRKYVKHKCTMNNKNIIKNDKFIKKLIKKQNTLNGYVPEIRKGFVVRIGYD